MKSVLRGAANTTENLASDAAKTTGNLASNVGNTAGNLASNVGATTGNLASNLGNTAGNLASNVGGTAGNLGSNLGAAATGATLGAATGAAIGGGLRSSTLPTSGLQGTGLPATGLQQGTGFQQGIGLQGTGLPATGLQQGTGFGAPGFRGSGALPVESAWASPTVITEHIEKPVIVKEKVLPQEKIEVQPIIHREREQLEVHEVVQPMHEKDIAPTLVKHATLPAQVRPDIRESDSQFQNLYKEATTRYTPEIQTQPIAREFYNKPAIVEEHISKKIVEEVQPILYRETVTPVLIEETQPIYERVVEAPVMVEEMRQTMELGTKIQPIESGLNTAALPATTIQPSIGQPIGFQRETFVTKEFIPAQDLQRTQMETKRIV